MVTVLQFGLPELVPQLIALAGAVVLVLALAALAGIGYQHLTGGIEWPDEDEDELSSDDDDDEWDYY